MKIFILCIEIFFARILDVSLGTIKTIYVVKEKRLIASIISFIETLIWFIVVKEALVNKVDSIFIPLSYALGFSVGTYIGMYISSKLIHSNLTVNVISSKIKKKDIECLKENGFGVTSISLKKGKTYLIIEIDKRKLDKLNKCLRDLDKEAFVIVNESKQIHNGYFI